jgi:hypothetical protein
LIKKIEIKNNKIKIRTNKDVDKNLYSRKIIAIEAKLPHVPGAKFMYPTKKIERNNLVRFFI